MTGLRWPVAICVLAVLAPAVSAAASAGPLRATGAGAAPPALDADLGAANAPFARRPSDGADDVAGAGYAPGSKHRHKCFRGRVKGKPSRTRTLCVHWVRRGDDAPSRARQEVPPQVRQTIRALKEVWRAEVVGLSYRPPLPDRGRKHGEGPNDGIDIYLADIGRSGFGGYCLNDDLVGKRHAAPRPVAAYCTVDDDFSEGQFPPPGEFGLEALRSTVAHEFFHAIQYAYSFSPQAYANADRWLYEGTAEWMGLRIFDPARNPQPRFPFLEDSPLADPEVPLDAFGSSHDGEDNEYGAWTFWQFLSEYAASPEPIRRIWSAVGARRAHLAPGDPVPTAAEIVEGALDDLAPSPQTCLLQCGPGRFTDLFTEFETWVGRFQTSFARGASFAEQLHATSPPVDGIYVLDGSVPESGPRVISVEHLSSNSIIVTAESGSVNIEVAVPAAGNEDASVVVLPYQGDDALQPVRVQLGADGTGALTVSDISALRLLLINASIDPQSFSYEVTQQ